MRHASFLGALLLFSSLPLTALAQVAPDIRQVTVPVLEVRSGPSDSEHFYITNRLPRGAAVEVVREEANGWLAIRPPEGSFSYINARFLKEITPNQPSNLFVSLPDVDVPVYIGSEVVKDHRPTNIGVRLKPGTQVTSVGKTITDPVEGAFMPIKPPHSEVRYILASEVIRAPAGSVFTASHTDSATEAGPLQPSNAPSANPPPTPESLYSCAQLAESRGDVPEAVRLYDLAAAQAVHSNPNLAKMAWQRVVFLQSGYQASGRAGRAGNRNRSRIPPPRGMSAAPFASIRRLAGATSSSRGQTVSTTTVRRDGPESGLPPGWISRKGWLRLAGRTIEGMKTYVINSESSYRPLAYVVSSGVDLAPYVSKIVEVQGPAVYLGDIRNNYVKAMRVIPR